MNQLTNQELIQELQKRVESGVIRAMPEMEKRTESLLSGLDSKNLLLLTGLTVALTFLVCYSLKVTTNSVTGVNLEFSDREGKIT